MENVQTVTRVRVGSLLPGINPRKYFDPGEMEELEASIKQKGVIQPILVRPVEGGFSVVAGERRWRASRKALGEDYEIPVLVKEISAEEADELALIENVSRADMSPTEEAEAAAKILARCNNDRDEAAKRLGWNRTMFDKRLALMNCSEGVRNALNERKILLGHAELLAVVPKAMQEKVVESLLNLPVLPPVAEFKKQLEDRSQDLDKAIFNKADCAGCLHNSGNQQALFAEAIGGVNCTNRECFGKKTFEELEVIKNQLVDEFPTVNIVNPGDNFTVLKLVAEGETGVGEEQAKACRACDKYGAAISNLPGSIGNVYRGQCFDPACNTEKVAARLKAEKAAQAPASTQTTTAGTGTAAGGKSAPAKAKSEATKVQDSQRVQDYRVDFWRKALKAELKKDPRETLSLLLGTLMTRGGNHVSSTKLATAFEKLINEKSSTLEIDKASALASKASDEVRNTMISGVMLTIVDSIEKNYLPQMLGFMEVDLTKHFKLHAEFLDLLTKSEIEVIAEELGLKAALGDKFSKTMGGKKDEAIKALLAVENFDYTGKMPKVLSYDSK